MTPTFMRRLAYWSAFSGSFGFGYGHSNVWHLGTRSNGDGPQLAKTR